MYPRDGCRCRPALFKVDAPPQHGVKARVAFVPSLRVPGGLSALTPRLDGGALEYLSRGGSDRLVER